MFEDDFADMCTEKFPLMQMGGRRSSAQTQKRGHPSHGEDRNLRLYVWILNYLNPIKRGGAYMPPQMEKHAKCALALKSER